MTLLRPFLPIALSILLVACQTTSRDTGSGAQQADGEVTFAFWNVENLFDADDDPANPGDDEYLPDKGWTAQRYATKLEHLATEIASESPHVIGFAEVENERVLRDLFAREELAAHTWTIVHRESADTRGIDLALAFRAPFRLAAGEDAVTLHPVNRDGTRPSRGVLEVRLLAEDHPLTVLVNHWPSRGSDRDGSFRKIAGAVCRSVCDATRARERAAGREADLVLIGDLNDDPWDVSVVESLGAVRSRNAAQKRRDGAGLWNASWRIAAEPDLGTLYYNPAWTWNVFDQMVVSRGLLDDRGFSYVVDSLRVHAPDHLRDHLRRPRWFRKNRDGEWTEGYSDHFMIVARLRY
jgi:hypothetical protein